MNKENYINGKLFQQIDIHFADYICGLENSNDFDLWLLSAFVSFFSNNGHSAFNIGMVKDKKIIDIFDIDEADEDANSAISLNADKLNEYNNAIGNSGELKPLIYDNGYYYLNRYHQYEITVSEFIKARATEYEDISGMKDDINKLFEENLVVNQPNWQKIAAIVALRAKFAVISGGPGTGKTTTVGKVLALLLKHNPDLRIKLVAPTGKAADRLNESIKDFKRPDNKFSKSIDKKILDAIPESAETIHRFIGINSRKLKFDKYSPAPIDLLLIDEASMVSLPLFAKTFEGLSKDCRVILLGDKDQLMAVENGNVLKDITNAENLNAFSAEFAKSVSDITDNQIKLSIEPSPKLIEDSAVQLEHSYRFDNKSGIGELSKFANNATEQNSEGELINLFSEFDDINIENIKIEKFINDFCEKDLSKYKEALKEKDVKASLESLSKSRILCALNETEFGVKNINQLIESKLFKESSSTHFYHGRPILITANDYRLNLMNGDVGIILKNKNDELKAYFSGDDNSFREINPSNLGEHTTAFAISIHKSQGSEFDNVFVILPDKENKILTKELIYTAITRAKKSCKIISSNSLFYNATIRRMHRQSGLTERI